MMFLTVLVGTSLVSYYVYKRLEPAGPLWAFLLLCVLPLSGVFLVDSPAVSTAVSTVTVLVSHWFLVLFYTVAYRISPFHPLAKFPGPFLCKISKVWVAWVTSQGNAHRYIHELHAKYGDVVRTGPNELSFCHESVVPSILGPKGLVKGPYYDTRNQEPTALDGIRDHTEHSIRRRPWNRATSVTALKYYDGLLKSTIMELLVAFTERQREEIDISDWMTFATTDFMGRMTFSTEFGMVRAGKDSIGLRQVIFKGSTDGAVISHIPWTLPFFKWLPAGGGKALEFMFNLGSDIARKRVESPTNKQDLYHYLIDEDGLEPQKPSTGVVTTDAMLSIVAGSDTSATALSHILYFLLQRPKCLQKLQAEIDETFPKGEDTMDFSKQAEMPYLNACINEALRLYPPVMTGLQRRVPLGIREKRLGNFIVPEGTQVSAHLFSLMRDPRYFSPEPDEFWPDRWLVRDIYTLPSGQAIPSSQVVNTKEIFIPFSMGSQNCPGKNVAMMEMRAMLCAVLQKFDVAAAKEFRLSSYEERIVDMYITHRGPLPVILTAR